MAEAVFLRVLEADDKGAALATAVAAARDGQPSDRTVFRVDPASFRQVPGTPFAYWVSEALRRKFRELPPFESEGREVRVGLQTSDDFRFVRAWWEVDPARILHVPVKAEELDDPRRLAEYQERCREETRRGKRWVPFAKGGAYSPYYADVYLVVDWENDGERIRNFRQPNGRLASRPQNVEYYFRPGLSWALRTRRFSPYAVPAGGIFSVSRYEAFVAGSQIYWTMPLLNSAVCSYFLRMCAERFEHPKFIVGIVQDLPFPYVSEKATKALSTLGMSIFKSKRWLRAFDEIGNFFIAPGALWFQADTLVCRVEALVPHINQILDQCVSHQDKVDQIAYELYGVNDNDRLLIDASLNRFHVRLNDRFSDLENDEVHEDGDEDDNAGEVDRSLADTRILTADLLSYAVGCCFGRWDVRIGRDPELAPPLPGPFDPLPVCAPGMLVGPDGLPARPGGIASEAWLRARPDAGTLPPEPVEPATIPDEAYPLRIRWTGLLMDDEDHPDDIVRCVGEVFEVLFGERAEAFLAEACGFLGVRDLREYFRNPRGFFADHLRRYSKKPRKAPIYWLLQSPRRHFAVWLYYPRLDGDLLWKALQCYVEPKIRREEQRLVELRARKEQASDARTRRQAERAVERQEEVVADITEFHRRLVRVAELHLHPNLDDGVPLNAAPLHELIPSPPWPEPGRFWKELVQGEYAWSHVGAQIQERLQARAKRT